MNRLTIALACCGLTASLALAAKPAPGGSTAITIYSSVGKGAIPPELYRPTPGQYNPNVEIPGYAMVRQDRRMDLPASGGTVQFTDVAAKIEPTTVSFASLTDPAGTRVLEQSFQFDLVSPEKLMERYLDKEVTVTQVRGDKAEEIRGTLLSYGQGLVLRDGDGRVHMISGQQAVRFPDLPGGLITRPTLVWKLATPKPGPHDTRVTYQTGGITWWADYNLIFTEGADANSGVLDVGAWVSILNKSGAGYTDAKLKLVAGDVHRAQPPMPMARGRMRASVMADGAVPEQGFTEKSFFEYHLYTLGRPTTLPDNSTQQLESFPTARGVKCEKVLVYFGQAPEFRSFSGGLLTERQYGNTGNKKVDIYLRFKNEQAAGMGMPLPAGRIRVSKLDPADKSLEFIGEDAIDHTPKDEHVLIQMGSAFDVVGERRQVDFALDTGRKTMTEIVEIKVRNHKAQPVKVIVRETMYRWSQWEIVESSQKHDKVDARTVEFPVTIEPDQESMVTYTVKYTW